MTFLFSPESRCPPIVVLSEGDEPRRGTVCWRWDSSAAQEGAIHLFPLFGLDIEEFPGPGWLWGVNPIGISTSTLQWDGAGRLESIDSDATASYSYDHLGRRILKRAPSDNTQYFYDVTGKVLWEFDPDETGDRQKMVRAYFNGRLFTSTGDAAAGSHTVYTDHLGTPRLKLHVTTAASEARDDYYPFGQQVNTVVDAAHDRRFTGKERDAESGLDYFGARYYHSVAGRFISVDPSRKSLDTKNPQSLNRYTYVLNSPLKLKDPDGKAAVLATLVVGAGTDAGLEIALNVLEGEAWHKDVGTAVVTGAAAGATGFGLAKLAPKAIKVLKAYRAARAAGKGANAVKRARNFSPADFADDVSRIRAESKARYGLDFPGSDDVVMLAKKRDIKQIDSIVRKFGFNKKQRKILHDEIHNENLNYKQIKEIAEQLKEQFPKKAPFK